VPKAESAEVLPGKGARCIVAGRPVLVGNAILLAEAGIAQTEGLVREADTLGATAVLVAVGDELAGAILLRDRVRDGARAAVQSLRDMGLKHLLMLTGDRRRAAELVAREVGIGEVEAELLPEQKLERVRALTAAGNRTAMIGDGVNDAPALASASVGIAVAGASDVTAEAADVIFLPHSLESLPELFKTSRRAVRTAWQNIFLFAGILNATAVLLAATGKIGPVGAAVTHQLSSFFVMMNSLRLLYVRRTDGGVGWRSHITEWLDRSPLPRFASRFRESAEHFEFDAIAGWVFAHRQQIRNPLIYTGLALFLLNGFYALKPDEVGIIERFGKKTVPNGEPGLHYKLPWPIDRLTRVQAHRVRVAEVGFRTNLSASAPEPAAYEWNVQHRTGRIQKVSEESLMLTGDQNMIELNATVQYSPQHPDDFLFRQIDGDATVRAAAESIIQSIVTQTPLDDLLTTGRKLVEDRARGLLQQRLDRYTAGVEVLQVRLEDVHPSLEVVDAFREVSGAFEEKSRLINEAEAYRNEQLALARGNAQALLRNAASYRLGRTNRASGDASRFTLAEDAFRAAPQATEHRLYLESIEAVLPGKKKIIVDKTHGKRHLLLLEDGAEIPSLGALN
jgi:HflK protein